MDVIQWAGDPREPSSYVRAARAFLEKDWAIDLPDLDEAPAAGSHTREVVRTGHAVGDLTRDGLDDALVLERDVFASTTVLHARNGPDGSSLWSVSLSPAISVFPLPAGDVTGDGTPDVLVHRLNRTTSLSCISIVLCETTLDTQVRLISGRDGSVVWSRDYPGSATSALGFVPLAASAFASLARNAVAVPTLGGDHDRDGLRDLVVNSFDAVFLFGGGAGFVAGAFAFHAATVATRSEVLSSRDGKVLLTRRQEQVPGGAILRPAGDLVGSPAEDLLWQEPVSAQSPFACAYSVATLVCAQTGRTILDLEAIDGSSLRTAWRARRDAPDVESASVTPARADLTGDGRADLLLAEADGPYMCAYLLVTVSCSWPRRQGVLSGADGGPQWQRDWAGYPLVLGPVGGSPGDDIALVRYGDPCGGYPLGIARVDGATGATLFTTSLESSVCGFAYAVPFPDADGDGVVDILGQFIGFSDEPWKAWIESGRTGVRLFSRQTLKAFVRDAGDLNGDGVPDLEETTRIYDSDANTRTVGLAALAVPSGALLWARSDTLRGFGFATIVITRDQSGSGGDDLLYSLLDCCPTRSRVESIDGRTGAVRWSVGEVFS